MPQTTGYPAGDIVVDLDEVGRGTLKRAFFLTGGNTTWNIILRTTVNYQYFGIGTLKVITASSASGFAASKNEMHAIAFKNEEYSRNSGAITTNPIWQTGFSTSGGSTTATVSIATSYAQDGTKHEYTIAITTGGQSGGFAPAIAELDILITSD